MSPTSETPGWDVLHRVSCLRQVHPCSAFICSRPVVPQSGYPHAQVRARVALFRVRKWAISLRQETWTSSSSTLRRSQWRTNTTDRERPRSPLVAKMSFRPGGPWSSLLHTKRSRDSLFVREHHSEIPLPNNCTGAVTAPTKKPSHLQTATV